MEVTKPSNEQLESAAAIALQKLKKIEEDASWQQFADKPCLMLKIQKQNRVLSRGQANVNIPLHQLFQKISKDGVLKQINPTLKQYQTLHRIQGKDQQIKVSYMRYAGVWPVQDRDMVNVGLFKKEEDVCWIASQSITYPYPKQDKVTRATCHIGGWVLKKIDKDNTYCIYISDVDLEGSIPQALKNQLSEKQAELPSRVQAALKNK